jgi:trehalose synthase
LLTPARFDPWKDHAQAVEAYRMAKRAIPDLQLALVGTFTAKDDPEAPTVYRAARELVADEPDVHLYTDASAVDATTINAFQVVSDVILQRSLRVGRPVIARPVGGITLQIEHERSGLLVSSAEECGSQNDSRCASCSEVWCAVASPASAFAARVRAPVSV